MQGPGEGEGVGEAQQPQRSIRIVLVCHEVCWQVGGRQPRERRQPLGIRLGRQREPVRQQQAGEQGRIGGGARLELRCQADQQRRGTAPLSRARRQLEIIITAVTHPRLLCRCRRMEERGSRQGQQGGLLLAHLQPAFTRVVAPAHRQAGVQGCSQGLCRSCPLDPSAAGCAQPWRRAPCMPALLAAHQRKLGARSSRSTQSCTSASSWEPAGRPPSCSCMRR